MHCREGDKKAVAEGDLDVTSKELNYDVTTIEELRKACLDKAQDFEATTKNREEKLKALAQAKKVISETTAGAESIAYGLIQTSFLQLKSGGDLSSFRLFDSSESLHGSRNPRHLHR